MEIHFNPALPQKPVIQLSPLKKAISDIRDRFKHDKARVVFVAEKSMQTS